MMCADEKLDNPTRIVVLSECSERRTSPRPLSETASRSRKQSPVTRRACHGPIRRPVPAFLLRGHPPSTYAFLIAKPVRVEHHLSSGLFSYITFFNRQNSVIRRTHSSPSFSGLRHPASSLRSAGVPGALCATGWQNLPGVPKTPRVLAWLPGTVIRVETHATLRKQTAAHASTRNLANAVARREFEFRSTTHWGVRP
jgi:hypothetical protein